MTEEIEKVFIGGIHEKLTEEKVIDESQLDPNFVRELIKYGGQDVMGCLQCGNCTGVCPISLKIDYKTRNIIKLCQFGLKKFTISTRWVCATCYRCYEHCPANLNPAEVMVALRHIAVREGIVPPFIRIATVNILTYGHSIKPDSEIEKLRKELDLKPLAATTPAFRKVVDELRTIITATGYDKLIKIDIEKTGSNQQEERDR
jgi:heterodisulfide reductase subunit C